MPKERIGVELRSINNLVRRYLAFSAHRNEIERATGNNGWIIGYLADHAEQDIYQKDIEEHFTIARSTASKVLTLMEQKGLIQRLAVAQDARLKRIVLTDRSWEIREIMAEDAEKLESTLAEGFCQEEIETLLSYLKRMKRNISAASHEKK